MQWDEKKMIVDTMALEESKEIQLEENLQGFFFDMKEITAVTTLH